MSQRKIAVFGPKMQYSGQIGTFYNVSTHFGAVYSRIIGPPSNLIGPTLYDSAIITLGDSRQAAVNAGL